MDLILKRRTFLGGMLALFAAPAIVRASSLMPIKAIKPDWLIVPSQDYFNLPGDIREVISGDGLQPWFFNDFVPVPNNALVRRSLDPAILRSPDAITAYRSVWHFPDPRRGYDSLAGVEAPDSWT